MPNTVGKASGCCTCTTPSAGRSTWPSPCSPGAPGPGQRSIFRKMELLPWGGRAAGGLAGGAPRRFRRWWRGCPRGRARPACCCKANLARAKPWLRVVHAASARAERPLVVVDCAACPRLLELELFGHGALACPPARGGWRRPRRQPAVQRRLSDMPRQPAAPAAVAGRRHLPPRGQQRIAPGRCADCGHHQHRFAQPSAGAAMARCAVPASAPCRCCCRRCANGGPMCCCWPMVCCSAWPLGTCTPPVRRPSGALLRHFWPGNLHDCAMCCSGCCC